MEQLKHECGVAMVRLLKPLEYYRKKYGTAQWGLNKLYLLMEKQHNRGQEGAGLCITKLDARPGDEYMFRERALGSGAITEIFSAITPPQPSPTGEGALESLLSSSKTNNNSPSPVGEGRGGVALGELYMGHLRYSTTGKSGISHVHPFMRRNNWRAKNLALCGNFNMTNVEEIFQSITANGQHPRIKSDTYIMLEQVGHRLDRESERVYRIAEEKGLKGKDITDYIEEHIDVFNVLKTASPIWDGGYVICGTTGSGEMFAMRDPWGIRPAFWYQNDEVFVLASERPVIQTAFDLEAQEINELQPGQGINISKRGHLRTEQILPQGELKPCSFERIYFSRGSDCDIYQERKMLGRTLTEPILKAIDGDLDNTVFAYIPNTAEVAFYGMLDGMKEEYNRRKMNEILALGHAPTEDELHRIFNRFVRSEKVAIKDIKLRTFITEEAGRNDLSAHVYDITYGSVRPGLDNLVIIDDSIVRGTTLRESIIRILDRLHPKKIVIVSSAPQVRYPDYYGIDMSRMDEFIAFRAAIALLEERGMWDVILDVYRECKETLHQPSPTGEGASKSPSTDDNNIHSSNNSNNKTPSPVGEGWGGVNPVKAIYAPFTPEEISAKMVEMLRPEGVTTPIELVFQSLEGLRETCPEHSGDWYFSGDYPTPGGLRMLKEAYIRYYESR